jgi:hypothetical protein
LKKEDLHSVDRSRIIPTIYGYAVCLIAIIVFLISISGFVNNIFRTGYPGSEGFHGRIATHGFRAGRFKHSAFGHWSMGHRSFGRRGLGHGAFNQRSGLPGTSQRALPNATQGSPAIGAQNQRFANFRNAFIARARLNAVRLLAIDFVLLIVSVLLFVGHWRWLNHPQPA